jgi:predicted PurR-regulated permease PerM
MRNEIWRWTARGVGFAAGLAAVAIICWALIRGTNVLLLMAVAILLAAGLEPTVGWIRTRTPLGRAPAILLVYAAFFVGIVLLILLVVPSAVAQLAELNERLPKILADIKEWGATLEPRLLGQAVTRLAETLRTAISSPARPPDGEDIVAAGATAAEVVISIMSVLALTFFWLTGHQRIQRFFLALLPADARHGVRLGWNEVETRLGLWVRGQLILMATVFVMTTVAYFVLGLEAALFLGLFAGIAEAIPIVGPAIGAVPALIVAGASGRVELIFLVAIVYVVIQVIEGNILVPMVMRSTIGVPPFIVIASLLMGAALGGVVGAFLAVPITAAMVVILERAQAREQLVTLESSTSDEETPDPGERQQQEKGPPDSRAHAAI